MKLYFIFTRRGLAVILALLILALVIRGQFSNVSISYADGSTHRKRMDFLAYYDISVDETPVAVKQTRLPQREDEYLNEYNEIALKGGFNLTDFCQKAVRVYTYELASASEKTVNLIVCEGKIIAGDLTDNLKGEIAPILRKNE